MQPRTCCLSNRNYFSVSFVRRTIMSKKLFLSICCVAALGFVNSAVAVDKNWTGMVDTNWFNANNWAPTGVPTCDPIFGDIVKINGGVSNFPVISSAGATCNKLWLGSLGGSGDAYLTMEAGGELTVNSGDTDTSNQTICLGQRAGTHGIITMNGGQINMVIGEECEIGGRGNTGQGTYNIYGGLHNGGNITVPGYGGTGPGVVNLDGGIMDSNDFSWASGTKSGTVNIYSGALTSDYVGFRSGGYCNLYGGVIDCNDWMMWSNYGGVDIYEGIWITRSQTGISTTYHAHYYAGNTNAAGNYMIRAYGGCGDVGIECFPYDPNLSEDDWPGFRVFAIFDLNAAYWPNPKNGFAAADFEQTLTWYPAYSGKATHHDIYFGTNFDDVNDANTLDSVYIGCQTVDNNSIARAVYSPSGPHTLGGVYYWRIDEVNEADEPDSIWKGPVWSFSISYVILEDFESYQGTTALRNSWPVTTFVLENLETGVVLGAQSMWLQAYTNFYAMQYEARRTFVTDEKWDPANTDARLLAFSVYGHAENKPDVVKIFVKLKDSVGNEAIQYVGHTSIVQKEEWTEVFFALNEFTSPVVVDLSKVTELAIGVENSTTTTKKTILYVDNVRLYPDGVYPSYRLSVVESEGFTQVTEAGPGSDEFTVELVSPPDAEVTLTIDPNINSADISLNSQMPGETITLLFTPSDWNTPQTVTVWAVNDYFCEGTEIAELVFNVSSSDPSFNQACVKYLYVTVIDNDTGDVVIAESGGSTEVSEEGPTSDQYTMVLVSQPTADVNIYLQDISDPDQVTIVPESLVFTAANWNEPQTVTVTAVNDNVWEDGAHYTMIGHTISTDDTMYQQVDIGNVSVVIHDNDKPDVHIVPVAVLIDPDSTSEVRTTLPDSIPAVVQGSIYYVEVWASDVGTINTGLTSVYVDVSFCEQASGSDVYHGTIFNTLPEGTIQPGGVDEFGGSALPSGGGIEPEWVRVGWIKMSGSTVETCTISLLPSLLGVAALDRGLISWGQIDLGSVALQITPAAKSYDLDSDDFIGPGDLSLFAASWLQAVPPGDEAHDFDCDGFVGVGDLSWFATGWGKYTDDPTILYPACLGAGEAMLAANNTTTDSSLLYTLMGSAAVGMSETLADIAFELIVLDAPSPSDTTTTLPISVNTITSDDTYYLEVWVSDIGGYDTGVISAYVDVNFPADVVTITDVSHGSIFTMFANSTVVSGLIDELGGSTLSEGIGKQPQWARVAVVEMYAVAAPPSVTFTLAPSSTGVSAYGRGMISWDEISLGTGTVNGYDINGDDKVDFLDFAILADQWFQAPGIPSADIAPESGDDGIVNLLDLNVLTEHWLEQSISEQ